MYITLVLTEIFVYRIKNSRNCFEGFKQLRTQWFREELIYILTTQDSSKQTDSSIQLKN